MTCLPIQRVARATAVVTVHAGASPRVGAVIARKDGGEMLATWQLRLLARIAKITTMVSGFWLPL